MKQNTILIAIIALLIGGMSVYLLIGGADTKTEETSNAPAGMHQMPDGTMMGDAMSMSDMDDTMPMGNMAGMDMDMMMVQSEREFLTGMIPHHQEAVDTAKEVIERGGSTPEIKTLAEDIVVAQEIEIAAMKQWYQDWYGVAYEAQSEDYEPMMRELAGLSGAELDERFLEDMIMHHRGAIMMARSVQPYIEHQEITDLAQAIITTQADEITLMRRLIEELN
jgi:uncharacterized protein (DUF305 family)